MAVYMITDGELYLKRERGGSFRPVRKEDADVYPQRNKADNIIKSCINKNMRSRYHIEEINDLQIESDKTPILEKEESKQVAEIEITFRAKDEVVKAISSEPMITNKISEWETDLEKFTDFIQNTEARKSELNALLSDVDQEISDIHHYIEFSKLNAYQGWLAFAMLKQRLKKRRIIKDEITVLSTFGQHKADNQLINNMKKSVHGLGNRKYNPRRLTQLFE